MIEGFDYKEEYVGTADTTDYTFDFHVTEASHLHIYVLNSLGAIVSDVLGDDPDVVAGVTFDSVNGGGTLSLAQALPNGYTLHIFSANDFPDQPTDFPNKNSFTFDVIEGALDYLTAWGQRAAFLAQRALRLHDVDDIDNFDMRLPINLSTFPGALIEVNSTGDGFAVGSTEAALSTTIVAAAELAMQQALAEGIAAAIATLFPVAQIHTGPFVVAQNTNSDLLGELTSHLVWTAVDYVVRIQRGTFSYARQEFSIFYRSGAWELVLGADRYADGGNDHGVTFTVNATTGQINASVANDGNGNATIDIYKLGWPT